MRTRGVLSRLIAIPSGIALARLGGQTLRDRRIQRAERQCVCRRVGLRRGHGRMELGTLPQPLGSMAAVAVDGVIHALGGATGSTAANRHTIG
jgi:hypothetical protein